MYSSKRLSSQISSCTKKERNQKREREKEKRVLLVKSVVCSAVKLRVAESKKERRRKKKEGVCKRDLRALHDDDALGNRRKGGGGANKERRKTLHWKALCLSDTKCSVGFLTQFPKRKEKQNVGQVFLGRKI